MYNVTIHRYEVTDSRLGRHVVHDERNRLYAAPEPPASAANLPAVRHHTNLPVTDQANLGACVGFAAVDLLGYDLYWNALWPIAQENLRLDPDNAGRDLYHRATQLDAIPGTYPPTDTGSDGPSGAKALKQLGYVSGYTHSFTWTSFMAALQKGPVMIGSDWYNSMFNPNTLGVVAVDQSSGLAGGHEYVADEYDPTLDQVGFLNSWGTSFGLSGRFYMKRADFAGLLVSRGDATIPVPLSAPAPVPVPPTPVPVPSPVPAPTVDADVRLAYQSLKNWAARNGIQ